MRIPGWTDRHSMVALAAALALVAAGAGLAERSPEGPLLVVVALVVFVLSLAGDRWAGLVIGLAAAALVIATRRAVGSWIPADFALAAVESAALVGTGWAAGGAGRALRDAGARDAGEAGEAGAVFGSTGMLPAGMALTRLEEEVARASSYRRPLSLALLEVEPVDPELDGPALDEVLRALARVTETMLREIDVPFLFAANRIGAILPETGGMAAGIASGRILEAISTGRFTHRRTHRRRALTDAVAVRLAVVSLSPAVPSAEALLQQAGATLERMRAPR